MLDHSEIKKFFFLGIGGIGMSALARYFKHQGYPVYGYDRTKSALTDELEREGIKICFSDALDMLYGLGLSAHDTLIVRTPAVPEDSVLYTYFRAQGYDIRKRAEVLGLVTNRMKALCVAGTHGKTTTSTMLAHLMQTAYEQKAIADAGEAKGVNAFLGGISMNYNTNLLLDKDSEYGIVEADEYDRSFHHLRPYMSIVTAVDADHLDIYGTAEAYREAFAHYTSLISGALLMKKGIALQPRLQPGVRCYTYSATEKADFYADAIRVQDGQISFDFVTPKGVVKAVRLGVPVWVNIENAVAAMGMAWLNGVPEEVLRSGMASFKGVLRRFNIHVNTPKVVYVDDYAHHPQEIATAIDSIRKLYPERKLIGVFQPHLYTRTRDFAADFARVLHTTDELLLLPIYPAREEPIPGVASEMLGGQVVQKCDLIAEIVRRVNNSEQPVVVLTVGAGDIDRFVAPITEALKG